MVDIFIVEILVNRIIAGGLNPKTGKTLTIEDIKNKAYYNAVKSKIANS